MLQFDFRKFVARAGDICARPRTKWALGLLASICMIGGSARPAAAGPPAGCTTGATVNVKEFGGGYDSVGLTWNDTDGAYEDSLGDEVIYPVSVDVWYYGPYYGNGNWYGYDIVWEIDFYDFGSFVDSWTQENEDDYVQGSNWEADADVSPHFSGTNPETDWDGDGTYSGYTQGYNDNLLLFTGDDNQ
jgi:hypothetical protein